MAHQPCCSGHARSTLLLRILLAAALACGLMTGDAFAQAARTVANVPAAGKRPSTPPDAAGRRVFAAAAANRGLRVLVSTEDRWLWLVEGRDTLLSVPVAVGMGKSFEFEGRRFWFETPRGTRRVLGKAENPRWNVPEWHYLERAASRSFSVVEMDPKAKYELSDGSFLLTIGEHVGRLNQFGNFYPFDPGTEIMFDSVVYVPPQGTQQRLVPEALGPYKLDTGDGYLIHGTHIYNEDSIGEAVSHGCVRMRNEDLEMLYQRVPVGTPVYIF
jgi:lipoprotein-anchoring transpeptidase ErfK/SrfK